MSLRPRRFRFAPLAGAAVCCVLLAAHADDPPAADAGDPARDAAVYAAVLASVNPDPSSRPAIVVKDRSADVGEILRQSKAPRAELHSLVPNASEALLDAFLAATVRPRSLAAADFARAGNVKVEVVPAQEVAHAFDGVPMAEAWRRLAEAHGGARVVVTFSAPAYDLANATALIYMSVDCGGLCGGGNVMLLARGDGAWRVTETHRLWTH